MEYSIKYRLYDKSNNIDGQLWTSAKTASNTFQKGFQRSKWLWRVKLIIFQSSGATLEGIFHCRCNRTDWFKITTFVLEF